MVGQKLGTSFKLIGPHPSLDSGYELILMFAIYDSAALFMI